MEMEQPTQTPSILAGKLNQKKSKTKTRTLHRARIKMVRA
jgi:hypothetical protein